MLSSHRSSASFVAALAGPVLLAGMAKAQLNGLRGTIPGSLHQCESTNMFFFDSSNTRPLTVLFLPTADVPASARSGTVQLADAAGYSPLQVIEGITTPDAAPYDFTLQLAEGTEFEVFAFFENGEGKALSLTRTVTTALPNASSCLSNVQTTVGGVAAAASTSSSSSSTRSSSTSSTSSRSTSSSMSTSRSTSSSTSARSTTSPTSAPTATAPAANTNFASLSSIIPSPTGAASRNAAGAVAGVLGAAVAGLALL